VGKTRDKNNQTTVQTELQFETVGRSSPEAYPPQEPEGAPLPPPAIRVSVLAVLVMASFSSNDVSPHAAPVAETPTCWQKAPK
jgi:hypothetical protein